MRMSAHEWKTRCVVSLLCLFFGCDENEASRRYPDVFNAAPSARDSIMLAYPLEDQIEIYLLGIRYRHPPAIYLGQTLALHGEKILPDMVRRLDNAKEDWEKRYLLFVLGYMSCWEVDLSEREEIIEAA
ncbi:MAG: hypothetical protein ACREOB_04095 [Thermodesulfobacteriota bacterium]